MKKINKKLRTEDKKRKLEQSQFGEGLFLFKNNNNASLQLPKISSDGKRWVHANETWEGDSFFLKMIPREAVLVKTIKSPNECREENKMNDKLLLDQPDQVTEDGTLEHIVSVEKVEINEEKKSQPQKIKNKKLLTEDPVGDMTIIIE